MQSILITGAAGFIGFHLTKKLCNLGFNVVGIDNINNYYDVGLKHARLDIIKKDPNFTFYPIDITDGAALNKLFEQHRFQFVVNLAAQAGVRYSLVNPYAYLESNLHV